MNVTVIYANVHLQKQVVVTVDKKCSVQDVILQSELLEQFPEIDLNINKVGIWGKIVPLETLATDGDRVEIYRPLLMDPKQIRKLKAKRN